MGGPTAECSDPSVEPTSSCGGKAAQPGARGCSHVFYDEASDLAYVFGGDGYDSQGKLGSLNDLWSFNSTSLEWSFIGGSRTADAPSSYAPNWPAGRSYAAYAWNQTLQKFVIFSGQAAVDYLPDVWEFDLQSKTWATAGNFTAPVKRKWSSFWSADGAHIPDLNFLQKIMHHTSIHDM